MWRDVEAFWDDDLQVAFELWLESKRSFTPSEVVGTWFKSAHDPNDDRKSNTHPQVVTLFRDADGKGGTLRETHIHEPDLPAWEGRWLVENGLLVFKINRYTLTIVASRDGLHSGVEDDESGSWRSYFRLGHLKA